jgi:hypothetical protein
LLVHKMEITPADGRVIKKEEIAMEERTLTQAEMEIIQMKSDMEQQGRFEYRVKTYRKVIECGVEEALKAIMERFPDDHREYLARCAAGKGGSFTE